MPNTKKTTEEYAAAFRIEFANLTSKQMNSRFGQPTGIMSSQAYSIVTLEKMAEEYRSECIAELRTMVDVTDEMVALFEVNGSPNGRCGLVLRLFTEIAAEEEADRLKMEELNG